MKKPAPRKKPADWLDSAGRCGMLTVTPGPAPRHRRGAGNDGEFSKGLYLGCGLRARQLTFSLPQGVRTFSHALALDEMDKLDFVGLNHYHGIPARMGPQGPEPVPFPVGGPSTAIGWPITPEALGWGARFLYQRYQKPLYISENGLSCRDQVFLDGQVHDPQRIDFLTRYLRALDRPLPAGPTCGDTFTGPLPTILSGPRATPSASAWPMWTTPPAGASPRTAPPGTGRSSVPTGPACKNGKGRPDGHPFFVCV